MEMKQARERIGWLDMAKGYGIILVILGHLDIGELEIWIYTFHVPLFFFLSGYVFNEKKNFGAFVKNKCKSLLIPYVMLGLFMVIYDGIGIPPSNNFNNCLPLIKELIIQRRMWTLWFIACLFFLNIIFYLIKKLLKVNLYMAIAAIVMVCIGTIYYSYGGPALPWNIDVCLMAYPFFFAGYYYRQNNTTIDNYLNNNSIIVLVISLLINVVCGISSYRISGQEMDMYFSHYGILPLTYISAMAGIICIIIISKKATIKPIQYIGENSLIYFAWHQTIMMSATSRLLSICHFSIDDTSTIGVIATYKIVQFVLMMVLLTICNWIISNSKFKFMLGRT